MTLFYSFMFVLGIFSLLALKEIFLEKKIDAMDPIERYEYHRKHLSKTQIRRLRIMPYSEYLKTEHWQLLRKAALYRDKYKCRDCGDKSKLEVHHRTYIRRGNERLSDVISLCSECHEQRHKS